MLNKKPTHPIRKASIVYGSQSALANELGISKGALNQWMMPGREVPIIHCAAVERLTGGEVTRKDLRPSDWNEIWPELVNKKRNSEAASHD